MDGATAEEADPTSEHDAEPRRVYITQSYRSPWATINPLWAAARERGYVPDKVHVLTPTPDSDRVQSLKDGIQALLTTLDKGDARVELVQDDPENFGDTADTIKEIVKGAAQAGHRVAVDLTPGRTIPKIALFDVALRERPDHVFYLSVPGYDYRPRPYVKVPFRMQRLMDLLEVVGDRGR